jgi:hypothetical protein
MPCRAESGSSVATAAGRITPACLAMDGSLFFVVASADGRRVSYAATTNQAFRTPDRIRVGDTLARVQARGGSPVVAEQGWAYFSRLRSGWCARFAGVPGRDPAPEESAPVVELFIRQ